MNVYRWLRSYNPKDSVKTQISVVYDALGNKIHEITIVLYKP